MSAIKPGTSVQLEISRLPTSESGTKTLVRLCRKDASVVRHHRQQKRKRPSREEWRRGGMTWHHQMESKAAVSLKVGARYQIRATLDVLRDLESIARFVKLTPVT
ncbi:MAG: hypothetical protein U1D55_10290 [Phycisphaerae bacterium]